MAKRQDTENPSFTRILDKTDPVELKRIKANIENAYQYFRENNDRFNKFRKFTFSTSMSEDDIAVLQTLNKPQIEVNIIEAPISRLRGEFAKQEPAIEVHARDGAPVDVGAIDVVTGYMRATLFEANNNGFEYQIYTDELSGGFSVAKVWTEYANDMSFDQVIKIGRVFDPTLCGFDPLARAPHKGDGRYAFEAYPQTKDDFKAKYPHVDINDIKFSRSLSNYNWSYSTQREDIIMVVDYYEKKHEEAVIVQLSNRQSMLKDDYKDFVKRWKKMNALLPVPKIVQERKTMIIKIMRYILIEDQFIEIEETNYKYLPLIFFDGNSMEIKKSMEGASFQMTRPYVYNAYGIQRLHNFAVQTLANELENMVQHKFMVAKEAIPAEYQDAYTNVQQANVLVYNFLYKNDPTGVQLPPPQPVPRVPCPPEVMSALGFTSQMLSMVLGNFSDDLSKNPMNAVSGIAIQELLTANNSASMPYVTGYLQGLNQIAQVVVDLIPKYLVTPRTIPVITPHRKKIYVKINQDGGVDFNFSAYDLDVKVEAGVSFDVQKSRALQQIIALMQASPLFAQFMNTEGLPVLLDNIEIKGIEQLKEMSSQWMTDMKKQKQMQEQMQQQQMQQPNPMVVVKQQELQQKAQQDQAENQLNAERLMTERLKVISALQSAQVHDQVQNKKANVEMYSHLIDSAAKTEDQMHRHIQEKSHTALKAHDQMHRHHKETIQTLNDIASSDVSSSAKSGV
jgi:hypothetical protein